MKHAPIPTPEDESDDELSRYILSLPPCPGIPTTDEEVAEAEAAALEDVAAGRVHEHAVVGEWLKTWGKPDFLPFEEWFAARNG